MSDNPVFVVGSSRSGTALLRSSLNGHPELHVASETHFFDDLRTRLAVDEPVTPADVDTVVDYFGRLSHRPYGFGGDAERGWLDREELRRHAAARGGYPDDFLAAWCALEGLHEDGVLPRRWGEKTPRHVYRLDDLLTAFPEAQVVSMVRDPRAVIASYRDWGRKSGFDTESDEGLEEAVADESRRVQHSYHPALATTLWRTAVHSAAKARRTHGPGRVRVVRYEDLVTRPQEVLAELCDWLGESFHESMVSVPVHNSSHMTFDPRGGFRPDAIDRWREKLDDAEVAVVQQVAGAALRACRYEPVALDWGAVRAAPLLATAPAAVLSAAMANRQRIGSLPSYLARRLRSMF